MHGNTKRLFFPMLIATLLCLSGCSTDWLIGHDNGEAYERYQEAMQQYINENWLEPDIYGYGW